MSCDFYYILLLELLTITPIKMKHKNIATSYFQCLQVLLFIAQLLGAAQCCNVKKFKSDLLQSIEEANRYKNGFVGKDYSALQFCGVYGSKQYNLINLCSHRLCIDKSDHEFTIIDIKKNLSCDKTHLERIDEIFPSLHRILTNEDERDVCTGDHQLSLYKIERANLENYLLINNEMNTKTDIDSIIRWGCLMRFKKVMHKSLREYFKKFMHKTLDRYSRKILSIVEWSKYNSKDQNIHELDRIGRETVQKLDQVKFERKYKEIYFGLLSQNMSFFERKVINKAKVFQKQRGVKMLTRNGIRKAVNIYSNRLYKNIGQNTIPRIINQLFEKAREALEEYLKLTNKKVIEGIKCGYFTYFEFGLAISESISIINNMCGEGRMFFELIEYPQSLYRAINTAFSHLSGFNGSEYVVNSIRLVFRDEMNLQNLFTLSQILYNTNQFFDAENDQIIYVCFNQAVGQDDVKREISKTLCSVRNSKSVTFSDCANSLNLIVKHRENSNATACTINMKKLDFAAKVKNIFALSRKKILESDVVCINSMFYARSENFRINLELSNNIIETSLADNGKNETEKLSIHIKEGGNEYNCDITIRTASSDNTCLTVSHNLPFFDMVMNDSGQEEKEKHMENTNAIDNDKVNVVYKNIKQCQILPILCWYLRTLLLMQRTIKLTAYDYKFQPSCNRKKIYLPNSYDTITVFEAVVPVIPRDVETALLKYYSLILQGQKISKFSAPLVRILYNDAKHRHCFDQISKFVSETNIDIEKLNDLMNILIFYDKCHEEENFCNNTDYFVKKQGQIAVYAVPRKDSKFLLCMVYEKNNKYKSNYSHALFILRGFSECLKNGDILEKEKQIICRIDTRLTEVCIITYIFRICNSLAFDFFDDLVQQYTTRKEKFNSTLIEILNGLILQKNNTRDDVQGTEHITRKQTKIHEQTQILLEELIIQIFDFVQRLQKSMFRVRTHVIMTKFDTMHLEDETNIQGFLSTLLN